MTRTATNGKAAEPEAVANVEPVTATDAAAWDDLARALNRAAAPSLTPADRSPSIGKLAAAIAKVMAEVTRVEKHGRNTFHNYDYAKAEDVAAMIGPKLGKAGLALLPTVVSQTPVQTYDRDGAPKPSGDTVDVELEILLAHESGEWLSRRWLGRGQDRGDKALNKCYTVAVKTFLIATFAIPTGDDPESDTSTDERSAEGGTNGQLRAAAGRQQTRSGTRSRSRAAAPAQVASEDEAPAPKGEPDESTVDPPSPDDWRALFDTAKGNGYEDREQIRVLAAGLFKGDPDNMRLSDLNPAQFAELKAAIGKPAPAAEASTDGAES